MAELIESTLKDISAYLNKKEINITKTAKSSTKVNPLLFFLFIDIISYSKIILSFIIRFHNKKTFRYIV